MFGIRLSAIVLTWVLAVTPGDREPASVIVRSKKLLPQRYFVLAEIRDVSFRRTASRFAGTRGS